MSDLVWSADRALFVFLNVNLATPLGDLLWPLITDYDRILAVRALILSAWLALLWKGGTRGRTAGLMLIPLLVISDQLSSTVIKELVGRARPCHTVGGVPVIPEVHLLVTCGGGKSFPSSHAVNNFAVAAMFAAYYRRWTWAFFTWATLVGLSRIFVGVHYPSDVLGGAAIGVGVGVACVCVWRAAARRWFTSHVLPEGGGDSCGMPGGTNHAVKGGGGSSF
jgi:undecaprenyl-diphosphatase